MCTSTESAQEVWGTIGFDIPPPPFVFPFSVQDVLLAFFHSLKFHTACNYRVESTCVPQFSALYFYRQVVQESLSLPDACKATAEHACSSQLSTPAWSSNVFTQCFLRVPLDHIWIGCLRAIGGPGSHSGQIISPYTSICFVCTSGMYMPEGSYSTC